MQNNNYDTEIVKDNKSIESILDELGISIEQNPFENEMADEVNLYGIE